MSVRLDARFNLIPTASLVLSFLMAGCYADGAVESAVRMHSAASTIQYVGRVVAVAEAAGGSPFGRITSLDLHRDGSAFVLDEMGQEVHLIGPEGKTRLAIGKRGEGPGEFTAACCLSVSSDWTRLSVLSPRAYSIDIFQVHGDSVDWKATIRVDAPSYYLLAKAPNRLNRDTTLIVAGEGSGAGVNQRQALLSIGADGNLIGVHDIAEAPADSLNRLIVTNGERTIFLGIPHGTLYLSAFARDGSYATALTAASSGYVITQYEPDGTVRHQLSVITGREPLTATESEEASRFVTQYTRAAEQRGATVDSRLPRLRQVIQALWFDTEDRLWAEHYVGVEDGGATADVYSPAGELLFQAHWPANIDLSHGAIRGTNAWGIEKGPLDEETLVRLVFSRREDVARAAPRPQSRKQ